MPKKENQISTANNILKQLRTNITAQDKEAAIQGLELGEATVTRYLNGEAKKIETALDLIKFFRGRIADRDRELQKHVA